MSVLERRDLDCFQKGFQLTEARSFTVERRHWVLEVLNRGHVGYVCRCEVEGYLRQGLRGEVAVKSLSNQSCCCMVSLLTVSYLCAEKMCRTALSTRKEGVQSMKREGASQARAHSQIMLASL